MKLLQLIYTSCKKGMSSGAGFQTWSMSEGISDDERREIERYGTYVPPTDLPTQPTESEIAQRFPVALRFFQLESGRFGICQSLYIGQDYSGRYGNYFCHALVLEEGFFPVYPIQLFGSPVFRKSLTETEAASDVTPPPLPALDGNNVFENLPLQLDNAVEAVKLSGTESVSLLVDAAVRFHETQRSLIITGLPRQVPYYLAALQMAFPIKAAHQLTFATYTHDPTATGAMVSVVPRTGSRFAFSDSQRNYENVIVELDNPDVPNDDQAECSEFARSIDLGYFVSMDILHAFQGFMDKFEIDVIDYSLDRLSHLYQLVTVGSAELTNDQILGAVQYADAHASPRVLTELADGLGKVVHNFVDIDPKAATAVASLLFEIAHISTDESHLETAYKFFFLVSDQTVMHRSAAGYQPVRDFIRNIKNIESGFKDRFTRRMLDAERIAVICRYMAGGGDAAGTGIYFRMMVETIMEAGYDWDVMKKNRQQFVPFIEQSVSIMAQDDGVMKEALVTAAEDLNFFVSFLFFCLARWPAGKQEHAALFTGYVSCMTQISPQTAAAVRSELVQSEHIKFAYREYRTLLENAADKPAFFNRYLVSVFQKDESYKEKLFSTAVNDYLDRLSHNQIPAECAKLISHEADIRSPQVMVRVVEGFEQGLSMLGPTKAQQPLISAVLGLKQRRKITTSPDITRLLKVGMESERSQLTPNGIGIPQLVQPDSDIYSLRGLNSRQATEYFAWTGPSLIRLVRSAKDHESLFRWFGASVMDKKFAIEYIDEIPRIMQENKKNSLSVLLWFMEFYLTGLMLDNSFIVVRERIDQRMIRFLAKLPDPLQERLRNDLLNSKVMLDKGVKTRFTNLLQGVKAKRESSFLNRVKRWFGGGKHPVAKEPPRKKQKNGTTPKKNGSIKLNAKK